VTATVGSVGTQASSTDLQVSSASPSTNQNVTFTATVTSANSGGTVPTGTVAFSDNGSPIGSCTAQPLTTGTSSSTANCIVSYPAAGSHSITAQYHGDTTYAGSTSSAKMVTVSAPSSGGGNGGGTTTTTTTTIPVILPVASGATLAQIFAAVQAAAASIDAQLTSYTPGSLANRSAVFFNISFLTGGTATIVVYVTPEGTAARSAASKRIKLTSGSATLNGPGRAKIKLNLSKKGRNALRHAKKARLSIIITFTPSNNPKGKQTSSSSVTLRSKKTTKKKK